MHTTPSTWKKAHTILLAAVLFTLTACNVENRASEWTEAEEILASEIEEVSLEGKCTPHFIVQYFDSIDKLRLISVSGASCQPEVDVWVYLTMSNGEKWQETRLTMAQEEGYFVVATDGGRRDEGGIHDVEDPFVCVQFGEDEPICTRAESTIPWTYEA